MLGGFEPGQGLATGPPDRGPDKNPGAKGHLSYLEMGLKLSSNNNNGHQTLCAKLFTRAKDHGALQTTP